MAVNAKNIQFDQPGAGLAGYGINADNLYPKLQKLYGARGEEAGGSKSIWDAMVKNTDKSLARADSATAQQFKDFLSTGKLPAAPTPGFQRFAAESLDYGLRETGRAQQHKPTSFLSTLIDPLVEIGLGAIPGVGPGLAIAYGGIKGGVEDGLMGALKGGLSGYAAGSFGGGVGNSLSNAGGWSTFANSPGTFFSNVGRQGLTALDSAAASAQNFLQHPIASLTGSAPSITGTGVRTAAGLVPTGSAAANVAASTIPNRAPGNSLIDNVISAGGVIAPIIGGIQAGKAAKDAAKIQSQATDAAINETRRQYDLARQDLAPWQAAGKNALGELEFGLGLGNRQGAGRGALVSDFTLKDFQADPGYQFRRTEGQRGITNNAAARGMQLSGATLKALNRYNSDLASTEYGAAFDRDNTEKVRKYNALSGLAGTGQAATNTGINAGANYSSNIGNYLVNGGNAQAAGVVGANNAMVGGINDAFNNYLNRQLLNRYAGSVGTLRVP